MSIILIDYLPLPHLHLECNENNTFRQFKYSDFSCMSIFLKPHTLQLANVLLYVLNSALLQSSGIMSPCVA
jgi:hypothetical protein